jgi:hypothetical protein
MREFFRGWKRKLGCVTLLLACLLMGVWIRSNYRVDFVIFNSTFPNHAFLSGFGRFRLFQIGQYTFAMDGDERETKISYIFHKWAPVFAGYEWEPVFRFGPLEAKSYLCDVLEADDNSTGTRHPMWLVPYWSIVVPLTAVSAWLLLSEPRTKSRQVVVPTIENI